MKSPKKVIPKLKKGELGEYGYKDISSKTAGQRHRSLNKAVKKYGALSVFRKLNALYVLNKNNNVNLSILFKRDRNYIKRTFMKKN